MFSKILTLRFPKTEAQNSVVCLLTKNFDLLFNILHAKILPRKEGLMVLELSGTKKNFNEGVEYLKQQGVKVQDASQDVQKDEEICVHCGACTAVCPTGALAVNRPEMDVVFDKEKCSACQLCVPTCPLRAMSAESTTELFFNETNNSNSN